MKIDVILNSKTYDTYTHKKKQKKHKKAFCEISALPFTSGQCKMKKHTAIRTVNLSLKEVWVQCQNR